MVTASTRVIPVSDKNRVKTVKKLENGGLEVAFHGGAVITLEKGDALIQEFIVYSILAGL